MPKSQLLEELAAKEAVIREQIDEHQKEIYRLGLQRAEIVQEMTQYANQFDVAEMLGIHQTRISRITMRVRRKAA